MARIGNAYQKLDKLDDALHFLNKSLSEHRAPDIVKKAQEIQKALKEKERLAYIDPQKSLESKQKGNELFTQGNQQILKTKCIFIVSFIKYKENSRKPSLIILRLSKEIQRIPNYSVTERPAIQN